MNDAASAVVAFDVGGTTLKAEVLGPDGSVWGRQVAATRKGAELVDQLASVSSDLVAELKPAHRDQVAAVGVAVPGLVDTDRGTSVLAANLGLREAPIAAPLSDQLGLPVHLGHDVTVAALAERTSGAAADVVDPVVVIVGTGVAAVSFVHGDRVRGVSGQAGELGHLVIRDDGPPCGCGRHGCLETLASADAVARTYEERTGTTVDGARDVVARLPDDPVAEQVWSEATRALADGVLMVAALLAPGAVVLGGGLAEAGETLLTAVRRHMDDRHCPAVTPPPLRTARFGARAGVVGAAMLARGELS